MHKDLLSFPIGSTMAVQCRDGGPYMPGLIEETNNTDQNGQSYIIRVIKRGTLIMHNTRNIHRISITMEQYIQEQIKKCTGHLEHIFMNGSSVEYNRILTPMQQAHR